MKAITRTARPELPQCHGLSCLAAAGGRLLHPGDAGAELLEAGGIRRATASVRVGLPLGLGSSVGLGRPRDRFAWMGVASRQRPSPGLARLLPQLGPGWARDAFRVKAIALIRREMAKVRPAPELFLSCSRPPGTE